MMWQGWKELRQLWRDARHYHQQQPQVDRHGNELEFLPAALEILETPASPMGRRLSLSIVSLFVFSLVWAWFGKVDIEAVAQGRIIPQGQVKAIQPLEIGKIEAIYVREGQRVEQGQALVKLDPTDSEVDVQQVADALLGARLNSARLDALLTVLDRPTVTQLDYTALLAAGLVQQASEAQLALQQRLLSRDLELYRATEAAQNANRERQLATIAATEAEISRLTVLKPLFDEQELAIRQMLEQGHVSSVEWLAAREKQLETSQGLVVQHNRLEEARAALAALGSEAKRQDGEFRSQRLSRLQEFRGRAREAELTLTKAREREANRYLRAPVAGTVQQLQVHTIGGVVQPAQALMVIVPDAAVLEVEASLLNKDIGFVQPGQLAEIKVESFPYTRYGLIAGEVRQISRDAVEREGIGRVYPMQVKLSQQRIRVGGRWEALQPGMSVTVEIKTGKRRLLEFFLAPFLKYQDESLHER